MPSVIISKNRVASQGSNLMGLPDEVLALPGHRTKAGEGLTRRPTGGILQSHFLRQDRDSNGETQAVLTTCLSRKEFGAAIVHPQFPSER
jgi:hypothetical protein